MPKKVVSPRDAAALIHSGDTVTTSGFVGAGVPDGLLKAVADRFEATGEPRDLTLIFAAGQGDGKGRGLDRLCAPGLVARVIGGHWGLIPALGARAVRGEIAGWNFPQGVISHLYRDIAAGKPGTLTHVGLETFVDPRLGGGRISDAATDELVQLTTIDGTERLFYRALPIHVALLRGSTADERGNVTMEREALILDNLAQAMAARNSGGVVIVQVDQIVAGGSLCARDVVIPGALVDAVVVAPPELHPQTYATQYNRYFTGRFRAPQDGTTPLPLDIRKVIARRCAFELPIGGVVNLGIGMPEGVASVAAEEGLLDHVTLTAEPGVIGGQPASGLDFGAAINTEVGRSTLMPVMPRPASRAFTASGPPAVASVKSVALLSLISSISSSKLWTERMTPGSSNKRVNVPLPGCRSSGCSSTMSVSEISPRSTRVSSWTAIGTL